MAQRQSIHPAGSSGYDAHHPPSGELMDKCVHCGFCLPSCPTYALWGELMSTRAQHCGAVGAILNGYTRDMKGILELNFPVFCYGSYAQDQAPRGKVMDYRVSVQIGQATICPGDILFGDVDGVCIVPKAAEEEVFVRALEKARGEKRVRKAIEDGMSTKEAFETFGIM
jgi:regulator of RNase E activity RraA